MHRIGRLLFCLGAAGVGLGGITLLDAYWRSIGVALAYPPWLNRLAGGSILLVGLCCLLLGGLATGHCCRATDHVPNEKEGLEA